MDHAKAMELVRRCMPRFGASGLAVQGELMEVVSERLCELWGGMGSIVRLQARFSSGESRSIIAKVIDIPSDLQSTSDRRKKHSYEVEARFYEQGHSERLIGVGAPCPIPLLIDRPTNCDNVTGGRLTICMTQLAGRPVGSLNDKQMQAALSWLARLHACYWGHRADEAVAKGGLHAQGCYWHLDTRLEELERWNDTEGFEGRMRRAARAIDARLKNDPCQTVCHGDAKSENMLFANDGTASMYDFQYIGKSPPGKDLAYCLICTSRFLSEARQMAYLEHYLAQLAPLLEAQGDMVPTLENLRICYKLGACDLARWMIGWNRRYWSSFRDMLLPRCEPLLQAVDNGKLLDSEEAYLEAMFAAFPT